MVVTGPAPELAAWLLGRSKGQAAARRRRPQAAYAAAMALTSASGTVPDFAAVRAEFALPTGSRRPCWPRRPRRPRGRRRGTGGSTPPTSSWSRSTRPGAKDLDQALGITRARRRVPGALRDRRPRRGRRAGRRRSTPRCAGAARPSTCPTAPCRCTRPCSPRARPACCRTARARPCCGRSTSTRRGSARPSTCGGPRCAPGPGSTTRACRPTSTPGVPTPPSRRCPSWARCAGPWRSPAARSSWSCPTRRSCPTARAAGPRGSGSGRPSRTGTRRSRCSRARRPRRLMLDAGVGVLRTLPAPEPSAVEQLQRTAATLGIAWPDGATAAQVLSGLPRGHTAPALALRRAASTLLRGAGYAAFDQAAGTAPPADPGHGGIGAPYAHVTAPLRRLVDRFGTEVCLAVAAGAALPEWLTRRAAHAAVGDGGVRRGGGQGGAGLRRPHRGRAAGRRASERSSPRSCCGPRGPENEPGEVFVAEPPVLASAPACRGRAKWCGWSWSKRIRRPAESRSGRE